jgi:hypothetical protein
LAKAPLNWDDSYIQASFKPELNAELLKRAPGPLAVAPLNRDDSYIQASFKPEL